ncbi:hypothetical protein [Tropicimonas aquimaris]|uniref:Uncharacterized protein n=1 Tax=Tropicimonas aquimaris TaxID=914152 RepID=A0ABW3IJK4_9RHOB
MVNNYSPLKADSYLHGGSPFNGIWTAEAGFFALLSKTRTLNFRAPNLRQHPMSAWLVGGWQELDRDEAMACVPALEHKTCAVAMRSAKDDKP